MRKEIIDNIRAICRQLEQLDISISLIKQDISTQDESALLVEYQTVRRTENALLSFIEDMKLW